MNEGNVLLEEALRRAVLGANAISEIISENHERLPPCNTQLAHLTIFVLMVKRTLREEDHCDCATCTLDQVCEVWLPAIVKICDSVRAGTADEAEAQKLLFANKHH